MLTKIAFTLAVVIGVLWFARRSRQRVVNNPAPAVNQDSGFPIGWLATGVVGLMIIAGGWLMQLILQVHLFQNYLCFWKIF